MYFLNNDLGFFCLFCAQKLYGYATCEKCNAKYFISNKVDDIANPCFKIDNILLISKLKNDIIHINYNLLIDTVDLYETLLNGLISINHHSLHNYIKYESHISMPLLARLNFNVHKKILEKYIKLRNIK